MFLAPATTITVLNQSVLPALNQNCSCGGVWLVNVPRTLTACSSCDIPHFPTSTLGMPMFGSIRAYPGELRRAQPSVSSSIGYNTPLSILDTPLINSAACAAQPANYSLCGTFSQYCRTDPLMNRDVSAQFAVLGNTYNYTRQIFGYGTGCPNTSWEMVTVVEIGNVCVSSLS